MKSSCLFVVMILSTLLILLTPTQATAQDCSLLTREGIYDYSSTVIDEKKIDSFINWFRSQTYISSETEQNRSVGVAAVIKALPASANYADGEKGFNQFKQDIESYQSGNHTLDRKVLTTLKTINDNVINKLGQCLTRAGLHGWLETTDDPQEFHLVLTFHSPGSGQLTAKIKPPLHFGNAICTGFRSGTIIYGDELRIPCRRKTPNGPVSIVVNASSSVIGGGTLKLPEIPPPPPPVYGGYDVVVVGPNGLASGSDCIRDRIIPGGMTVTVRLAGSWNIYNNYETGDRAVTGIAVNDSRYPTRIKGYDTVLKQDFLPLDNDGVQTLTAPHPYYVCLDYPNPPRQGGQVRANDNPPDPIRVIVKDIRTQ